MKIVFLQHLWYEWQAPMILSAIAKQKGHTAELYIEPNPITAALRVVERGIKPKDSNHTIPVW